MELIVDSRKMIIKFIQQLHPGGCGNAAPLMPFVTAAV